MHIFFIKKNDFFYIKKNDFFYIKKYINLNHKYLLNNIFYLHKLKYFLYKN
jgi:hypothetical protein